MTAVWSAHHIRRNAASRRTELCSASALSSTNRHIACASAPFARRSSVGGEPLLDAAVELGVRAHLVGRLAHGAVAHADDEQGRADQVHDHADAEPPVEHEQHAEHAGEQQHRADDLRHDLRQEVGHVGDVAVDALDQLAGRVPAMELVVEPEHVAR